MKINILSTPKTFSSNEKIKTFLRIATLNTGIAGYYGLSMKSEPYDVIIHKRIYVQKNSALKIFFDHKHFS